ncbi:MAG TPA: hypothetical protein H9862_00725 [Candidatus Akkermansia intestinigallinarum]|uniref:Potassium transporter n=1 Tax=Candidatus Akkermansia intestinigallinarum TaxID=2838431 RepID=A0A9D1V9Q8_9BACT|nr:hypothetical protein [Candidatus Akkermansia intestinigallinarum]
MNRASDSSKTLVLPELIVGSLVLLTLLIELCFVPLDVESIKAHAFINPLHLLLALLVWVQCGMLTVQLVQTLLQHDRPARSTLLQFGLSALCSVTMAGTVFMLIPPGFCWLSLGLSLVSGFMSAFGLSALIGDRLMRPSTARRSSGSSVLIYFCFMIGLVLISALILISPGACSAPVSFIDACFMCASAASNTGLTTVNVADNFTWLGRTVLLIDFEIGAMGIMTFTYFVLLMVGRRLATRDSMTVSSILDHDEVSTVPALIRTVICVTLLIELIGAVGLYFSWLGNPVVPQDTARLIGFAIFHSVSAFCNSGLTLFPDNMATSGMAEAYVSQGVLMLMAFSGMLGFGVYLECLTRMKRRMSHRRNPLRWSTHAWLVTRVTLIITLVGTIILALLGIFEPNSQNQGIAETCWDALWNNVGRCCGTDRSNLEDYGPVYKITLVVLMFIGGNPAGTGGGVYAPVFAICVMEVCRVLRGERDLTLYSRCIARATVDKAVVTVVLGFMWVTGSTMIIMLLEPQFAAGPNGFLDTTFLVTSAFGTSGYSYFDISDFSTVSKLFLSVTMIFGRLGMFTTMLLFIKPRDPSPIRYPETKLPLT